MDLPTSELTDHLFVGRQPIYDRQIEVAGYELLFRSGRENRAVFEDGDLASTQVIVTAFMEVGLEHIVGSHRAYINLTRRFVTGGMPLPMTPDQVMLEVLEDIAIDEESLGGLRRLADQGFKLVLDDFVYSPEFDPVLEFAHGVKLDVLALDDRQLRDHVDLAHKYKLSIVAERVETQAMYEHCRDLGCDLFQGFFFCRPQIIRGRPLPGNQLAVLALIARLEAPDVSVDELGRLLVQDVTLSYRLLRYVNCASFALRKEVKSVRQAIVMVGSRVIRNWAALILFSRIRSDKPRELLVTAMIRARMCQSLARLLHRGDPEEAFTTGLFSMIDAILDYPMDELLDQIALVGEIKMALRYGEGDLGKVLEHAVAYERADWPALEADGVDAKAHTDAYLEAVRWAEANNELLRSL